MIRRPRLAKGGLVLASSLVGLAVLCAGSQLATGDPLTYLRRLRNLSPWPDKAARLGIFRDDARLGYSYVPLATGRHRTSEFDVRYSIDATGCRVTPAPPRAKGVVLALGDSFTFGQGVADGDAYPAILGSRYWRRHKVRNCGGLGWGTGQAALVADDALAGPAKPSVVIYGWIWPDARRNYLRRSWLKIQNRYLRRIVHFEIVDGRLRYEGTAGPELGVDDDAPGLVAMESSLTLALVGHMARAAAARAAAFYLVILPYGDPATPMPIDEELIAYMRRNRIRFVDLRALESARSHGPLGVDRAAFFPLDTHPNAAWHAAVAAAIAERIVLD
ncbi:MAG TPA: hypothetical protein VGS57_14485 [Thermoanaerobaculia bacterium]|nr:hypothetical protein [Thermoanaerobaculia bacterium]